LKGAEDFQIIFQGTPEHKEKVVNCSPGKRGEVRFHGEFPGGIDVPFNHVKRGVHEMHPIKHAEQLSYTIIL